MTVEKTEADYANEARAKIDDLCETLTEALEHGMIVNFGVNVDPIAKKATLTSLTVAKSYV